MSRIKSEKQGQNLSLLFTHQDNRTGRITFKGDLFEVTKTVMVPNGTAAAPSLRGNYTNSGIYFGSGIVYFSTAGVERASIDGQGDFNINDGRGIEGGVTGVGGYFATFMPALATDNITAGTAGAISIATYCTTINTDGNADAYTLADGKVRGQLKKIYFIADGGGDGVVTGKFNTDGAATTLTFSDAGEYAILMWNGTGWVGIELGSVMTITHAPVIS